MLFLDYFQEQKDILRHSWNESNILEMYDGPNYHRLISTLISVFVLSVNYIAGRRIITEEQLGLMLQLDANPSFSHTVITIVQQEDVN